MHISPILPFHPFKASPHRTTPYSIFVLSNRKIKYCLFFFSPKKIFLYSFYTEITELLFIIYRICHYYFLQSCVTLFKDWLIKTNAKNRRDTPCFKIKWEQDRYYFKETFYEKEITHRPCSILNQL